MSDFLTVEDLQTHIYQDIITEIIRDNEALVPKAINAALGEVKSYLNRYDIVKLFSGEIDDEHLKDKVKDVACFKLIKLANPNIDFEVFKGLYKDAIAWFKEVRDGECEPQGWPYKEDISTDDGFDEASGIGSSSNRKRQQHY